MRVEAWRRPGGIRMFTSGSRIAIVLAACVFAGAGADALEAKRRVTPAPALRPGFSGTDAGADAPGPLLFSPLPFSQARFVQPSVPPAGIARKAATATPIDASDPLYDAGKFLWSP